MVGVTIGGLALTFCINRYSTGASKINTIAKAEAISNIIRSMGVVLVQRILLLAVIFDLRKLLVFFYDCI